MSKTVVKIGDFDTSGVSMTPPEKTSPKLMFAKADATMIQTCELPYTLDNGVLELLCDTEHADKIHQIDEGLCSIVSEQSLSWFGQKITYDQIEKMFRPTLQGNKNPRHILQTNNLKTFDADTNLTDSFRSSGSGIFIIKLEGVAFEEKVCEAQWTVLQAKECVTTTSPQPWFV